MKEIALGLLASLMISVGAYAQGSTAGSHGKPAASPRRNGGTQGGTGGSQGFIEKLERDRAAAVIKGDTARLDNETADDATFIDRNGQIRDKAQTINAIKSGDIKLTSNDLSELQVRVYGNTAVITGKSNAKGTIGGKGIAGPVRFTRVYVKKNGHWQSVAFQQTLIVGP